MTETGDEDDAGYYALANLIDYRSFLYVLVSIRGGTSAWETYTSDPSASRGVCQVSTGDMGFRLGFSSPCFTWSQALQTDALGIPVALLR